MEKQTVDKLIVRFSGKIYGFAVKKSYSYDEAEDLCAEMTKEVYLSLLQAENVTNIEGYIWRICEHTFAKYVNQVKNKRGISLDGLQLPYYDEHNFDEDEKELKRLRKEIGFLSSQRREIVYSFYYEGKSIVQIAKEQKISDGTVKWHLNKARKNLKEGFTMERKTGSLGLSPVCALNFSHSGKPGSNGGLEYYLNDKINLNIVYSVYDTPKNKEEISEALGMTPVYLEERIQMLAANGFLTETKGGRYTTYVKFSPDKISLEGMENILKIKLKAAKLLTEKYIPKVRAAISDFNDVYIPGEKSNKNKELFEAAVIFYAVENNCALAIEKNLSRYRIKTLDGGDYFAGVDIKYEIEDPEYKGEGLLSKDYKACGPMTRESQKYPGVFARAVDSRFDSRKGGWQNNLTSDYESIYEIITNAISDTKSNEEKFNRLREQGFITDKGKINIMVVKSEASDFFNKIPMPDKTLLDEFAKYALDQAMIFAKLYPQQMQDLVIVDFVQTFIGTTVAMMVLDELYENGTFKPLTEQEKIAANLLMFADTLPSE